MAGVSESLSGYNMFAYCFNNPVNMADNYGNWPQWIKDTVKWVAGKIINPIVKNTQSILSKINVTVTNGLTGGTTLGLIGMTFTPCVSTDTDGNVALQFSFFAGLTSSPGLFGASVGMTSMITNAPSVFNLEGEGGIIGISKFIPITQNGTISAGGGIDINFIPDDRLNKTYYGISCYRGVSTSMGGEAHAGLGYTIPIYAFNVFDKYDDIYDYIMGW